MFMPRRKFGKVIFYFLFFVQQVTVFLSIELQSKWVACVLSGKAILPSEEEMLADVEQHYKDMEDQGVPKHHTHKITPHEVLCRSLISQSLLRGKKKFKNTM